MYHRKSGHAGAPSRHSGSATFRPGSENGGLRALEREPIIAVVEDAGIVSQEFGMVCEFLEIKVHPISTFADLGAVLATLKPMAVICEADGQGQDGCHVMKTVAEYDRGLPIMVVTGDDPAVAGAVEAVEDIWRLSEVTSLQAVPNATALVDFLFRAGRKANCVRFLPK